MSESVLIFEKDYYYLLDVVHWGGNKDAVVGYDLYFGRSVGLRKSIIEKIRLKSRKNE